MRAVLDWCHSCQIYSITKLICRSIIFRSASLKKREGLSSWNAGRETRGHFLPVLPLPPFFFLLFFTSFLLFSHHSQEGWMCPSLYLLPANSKAIALKCQDSFEITVLLCCWCPLGWRNMMRLHPGSKSHSCSVKLEPSISQLDDGTKSAFWRIPEDRIHRSSLSSFLIFLAPHFSLLPFLSHGSGVSVSLSCRMHHSLMEPFIEPAHWAESSSLLARLSMSRSSNCCSSHSRRTNF